MRSYDWLIWVKKLTIGPMKNTRINAADALLNWKLARDSCCRVTASRHWRLALRRAAAHGWSCQWKVISGRLLQLRGAVGICLGISDAPMHSQQGFTKGMPRLLSLPTSKIADGCLSAATLHSDLWLRQLAVTLNVGNDVFPVHCTRITDFRYKCNGFLITLFRKL